jgi:acyl-ACP thioesterase
MQPVNVFIGKGFLQRRFTIVELQPPAAESRTFSMAARVRLGDVSPRGRLRLDGIARLLQDVATDDAVDGAPGADDGWVVRRTTVDVAHWPRHREDLTVTTWCSGYGRRWALRRTSLVGAAGGLAETESLWIHVDQATDTPGPDLLRGLGPRRHRHLGLGPSPAARPP